MNLDPYKIGDRNYVDKDPDNKVTYIQDITDDLLLNGVTATGVAGYVDNMLITKQPTVSTKVINGVTRTILAIQVKGPLAPVADGQEDASWTCRVVLDNGDDMDYSVWVKAVQR